MKVLGRAIVHPDRKQVMADSALVGAGEYWAWSAMSGFRVAVGETYTVTIQGEAVDNNVATVSTKAVCQPI